MSTQRPLLVLGPTGKSGAPLVSALRAAGSNVWTAGRRPTAGARHRPFDWTDESTWAPALEGIEALYLVKPAVDPDGPVRRLLDRARHLRHVVLLSEMGRQLKEAGDPDRAVEEMVADGPWEATILRPSWFVQNWGPEGHWGERVRRTGEIVLPSGDAAFSLVDVRDVADVAAAALHRDRGLGPLTLTGPESLTLGELAARIEAVSGRPVTHLSPPLEVTAHKRREQGLPLGWQRYMDDLEADAAAGVCAPVHADVTRVLGRPARTVDDYLEQNAAFWAGTDA